MPTHTCPPEPDLAAPIRRRFDGARTFTVICDAGGAEIACIHADGTITGDKLRALARVRVAAENAPHHVTTLAALHYAVELDKLRIQADLAEDMLGVLREVVEEHTPCIVDADDPLSDILNRAERAIAAHDEACGRKSW
jgi:hypothetical protein